MAQVEEHNSTRLKLNADMADSSNLVKQLLIKGGCQQRAPSCHGVGPVWCLCLGLCAAEDARILGDMAAMRRHYKRLNDLNRRALHMECCSCGLLPHAAIACAAGIS
jgi:Bardet-Biedl syndrome 2 protein